MINNSSYNEEYFSKKFEKDFADDCPGHKFVPVVLPAVERIVAIGDIHGDLTLAIKSFILAKLMNDNRDWIAVPLNTVVVQVGDQVDSCRPIPGLDDCHNRKKVFDTQEDVKVMEFFNEMDQKARKYGGAVYSLFGNHELMNVQGRFDYVSYSNFYEFDHDSNGVKYAGPEGRKKAFEPAGPISKMMACTRTSVLIIGSNMFAHAGVLPILVEKLEHLNISNEAKLKYINTVIRKWLLNKLNDVDRENRNMFVDNVKISPFWNRIYGMIPEKTDINSGECNESVKKILEVYKIGHIIVGHTPQMFVNKDGINGTCHVNGDNKLFRVDGGFSKAFKIFGDHDMVQVLEIINDVHFKILKDKHLSAVSEVTPIDIDEKQMEIVSSIFSQNRISSDSTGATEGEESMLSENMLSENMLSENLRNIFASSNRRVPTILY